MSAPTAAAQQAAVRGAPRRQWATTNLFAALRRSSRRDSYEGLSPRGRHHVVGGDDSNARPTSTTPPGAAAQAAAKDASAEQFQFAVLRAVCARMWDPREGATEFAEKWADEFTAWLSKAERAHEHRGLASPPGPRLGRMVSPDSLYCPQRPSQPAPTLWVEESEFVSQSLDDTARWARGDADADENGVTDDGFELLRAPPIGAHPPAPPPGFEEMLDFLLHEWQDESTGVRSLARPPFAWARELSEKGQGRPLPLHTPPREAEDHYQLRIWQDVHQRELESFFKELYVPGMRPLLQNEVERSAREVLRALGAPAPWVDSLQDSEAFRKQFPWLDPFRTPQWRSTVVYPEHGEGLRDISLSSAEKLRSSSHGSDAFLHRLIEVAREAGGGTEDSWQVHLPRHFPADEEEGDGTEEEADRRDERVGGEGEQAGGVGREGGGEDDEESLLYALQALAIFEEEHQFRSDEALRVSGTHGMDKEDEDDDEDEDDHNETPSGSPSPFFPPDPVPPPGVRWLPSLERLAAVTHPTVQRADTRAQKWVLRGGPHAVQDIDGQLLDLYRERAAAAERLREREVHLSGSGDGQQQQQQQQQQQLQPYTRSVFEEGLPQPFEVDRLSGRRPMEVLEEAARASYSVRMDERIVRVLLWLGVRGFFDNFEGRTQDLASYLGQPFADHDARAACVSDTMWLFVRARRFGAVPMDPFYVARVCALVRNLVLPRGYEGLRIMLQPVLTEEVHKTIALLDAFGPASSVDPRLMDLHAQLRLDRAWLERRARAHVERLGRALVGGARDFASFERAFKAYARSWPERATRVAASLSLEKRVSAGSSSKARNGAGAAASTSKPQQPVPPVSRAEECTLALQAAPWSAAAGILANGLLGQSSHFLLVTNLTLARALLTRVSLLMLRSYYRAVTVTAAPTQRDRRRAALLPRRHAVPGREGEEEEEEEKEGTVVLSYQWDAEDARLTAPEALRDRVARGEVLTAPEPVRLGIRVARGGIPFSTPQRKDPPKAHAGGGGKGRKSKEARGFLEAEPDAPAGTARPSGGKPGGATNSTVTTVQWTGHRTVVVDTDPSFHEEGGRPRILPPVAVPVPEVPGRYVYRRRTTGQLRSATAHSEEIMRSCFMWTATVMRWMFHGLCSLDLLEIETTVMSATAGSANIWYVTRGSDRATTAAPTLGSLVIPDVAAAVRQKAHTRENNVKAQKQQQARKRAQPSAAAAKEDEEDDVEGAAAAAGARQRTAKRQRRSAPKKQPAMRPATDTKKALTQFIKKLVAFEQKERERPAQQSCFGLMSLFLTAFQQTNTPRALYCAACGTVPSLSNFVQALRTAAPSRVARSGDAATWARQSVYSGTRAVRDPSNVTKFHQQQAVALGLSPLAGAVGDRFHYPAFMAMRTVTLRWLRYLEALVRPLDARALHRREAEALRSEVLRRELHEAVLEALRELSRAAPELEGRLKPYRAALKEMLGKEDLAKAQASGRKLHTEMERVLRAVELPPDLASALRQVTEHARSQLPSVLVTEDGPEVAAPHLVPVEPGLAPASDAAVAAVGAPLELAPALPHEIIPLRTVRGADGKPIDIRSEYPFLTLTALFASRIAFLWPLPKGSKTRTPSAGAAGVRPHTWGKLLGMFLGRGRLALHAHVFRREDLPPRVLWYLERMQAILFRIVPPPRERVKLHQDGFWHRSDERLYRAYCEAIVFLKQQRPTLTDGDAQAIIKAPAIAAAFRGIARLSDPIPGFRATSKFTTEHVQEFIRHMLLALAVTRVAEDQRLPRSAIPRHTKSLLGLTSELCDGAPHPDMLTADHEWATLDTLDESPALGPDPEAPARELGIKVSAPKRKGAGSPDAEDEEDSDDEDEAMF